MSTLVVTLSVGNVSKAFITKPSSKIVDNQVSNHVLRISLHGPVFKMSENTCHFVSKTNNSLRKTRLLGHKRCLGFDCVHYSFGALWWVDGLFSRTNTLEQRGFASASL